MPLKVLVHGFDYEDPVKVKNSQAFLLTFFDLSVIMWSEKVKDNQSQKVKNSQ